MGFSIHWTDVPEQADDDGRLEKCFFECGEGDWEDAVEKSQYTLISGDNYPALRLLEKNFSNRIDFMYIDPPYNTGKKNFVYNDSLYIDKKTSVSTGDRHSAWLSFMSRRLSSAKKLLSQKGCIFISIGKEELYHLKLLCDQIFGEENFVNDFMWLHGKGKKDSFSRTMQQSTLCYARDIKKLKPFSDFENTDWARANVDSDPRGDWFSGSISFSEKRSNPGHPNFYEISSPSGIKWKRQWLVSRERMECLLSEGKIYFGPSPEFKNVPRQKIFNGEKSKIIPKNIICGAESTRAAQTHLDLVLGEKNAFDNPKPVDLIEHFISISNMKDDILVLDFFAGSGTTMEAVYNLNRADGGKRRCILVQKEEKIDSRKSRFSDIYELCLERVKKVTGKKILELKLSDIQ